MSIPIPTVFDNNANYPLTASLGKEQQEMTGLLHVMDRVTSFKDLQVKRGKSHEACTVYRQVLADQTASADAKAAAKAAFANTVIDVQEAEEEYQKVTSKYAEVNTPTATRSEYSVPAAFTKMTEKSGAEYKNPVKKPLYLDFIAAIHQECAAKTNSAVAEELKKLFGSNTEAVAIFVAKHADYMFTVRNVLIAMGDTDSDASKELRIQALMFVHAATNGVSYSGAEMIEFYRGLVSIKNFALLPDAGRLAIKKGFSDAAKFQDVPVIGPPCLSDMVRQQYRSAK